MAEHPGAEHAGPDALERRRLMLAAGGAGLAVGAALVVRNQIRHPYKNKHVTPDGRPRRLTLAATGPRHDPVLLAARDQGLFARYRLDIAYPEPVLSGRDALDQVQSGQADAAVASALSWLPRLQAGLAARLVCGLQAGSSRLLVARRSPFRRIEDLHRHVIGIGNLDSPDRLFFSIMMRRKGMDPNHDVEWRQLPPEGLGLALSEGQVQAVAGHDPAIWLLRDGLHFDELASSMSGSYSVRVSRVLGLRNTLLHDDPVAAVALTLAMQDAARWVAMHPQETATLLAAESRSLTVEQCARMLKSEGRSVHPVGKDLRDQVAQYMDELKLIGLTPETLDSAAFAKSVTANVLKA
ncbi:ABC transporter substrate-binding protein [Lichenicoccus sp.]|uniref:ABC transporter substrate-binding protein n=1 Tax=Lichenicoccus sp. TaxID=2781899 RepID=UPI003D0D8A75